MTTIIKQVWHACITRPISHLCYKQPLPHLLPWTLKQSRSWIPASRRQLYADSGISSLSYRTDWDWSHRCEGKRSFLRGHCCPAPALMVRSWSELCPGCSVCSVCSFCICCDSQLWSPERKRLICTLDMKLLCWRGLGITRIYVFAWEGKGYTFCGLRSDMKLASLSESLTAGLLNRQQSISSFMFDNVFIFQLQFIEFPPSKHEYSSRIPW